MILEIIAFDIQGCLDAQAAGANRIELCADPHLGGTTPAFALIEQAIDTLSIPVSVMIRPRGGNFSYAPHEIDAMLHAIDFCKQASAHGVVFGVLDQDLKPDTAVLKSLLAASSSMQTTFHRAFDVSHPASVLQSLDTLVELSFTRLLTSGLKPTAVEGLATIQTLIAHAGNKLIVMPGSGLTSSNIKQLKQQLNTTEFHASAKKSDSMGQYAGVDMTEVAHMAQTLHHIL